MLDMQPVPTSIEDLRNAVTAAEFRRSQDQQHDRRKPSHGSEGNSPVPSSLTDIVKQFRMTAEDKDFEFRLHHPAADSERLSGISTAWVFGKQDELYKWGKVDMQLVSESDRVGVLEHTGGHEMPRSQAELVKLKEMIMKNVAKGEF